MKICSIIKSALKRKKSGMHFSLTLNTDTIPFDNLENVRSRIQSTFIGNASVNPLPNYYIISAADLQVYANIVSGIISIAREYNLRFVVSPLMNGGTYNGLIDPALWQQVNNISAS